MAGHAGILNSWPLAFFCKHIAVANTAGANLDAHLPPAWLRNLALDDLEIGSRFRNLRHLHGRDSGTHRCHDPSFEVNIAQILCRKACSHTPGESASLLARKLDGSPLNSDSE